jgi:hypothetical protein
MKGPDEVNLSREEGEALIKRLEGDALTADDRRILVKLVQYYGTTPASIAGVAQTKRAALKLSDFVAA